MGEAIVATETIDVGPDLVAVVMDFAGRYTLYLDVGGSAQEVLAVGAATHTLVMVEAPVRTIELDWHIKVTPNYFQHGKKLSIYCVLTTPAVTGKLSAAEVG